MSRERLYHFAMKTNPMSAADQAFFDRLPKLSLHGTQAAERELFQLIARKLRTGDVAERVYRIATAFKIPGLDTDGPSLRGEAADALDNEVELYNTAINVLCALEKSLSRSQTDGRSPLVNSAIRGYVLAKARELREVGRPGYETRQEAADRNRLTAQLVKFIDNPPDDPLGHGAPSSPFSQDQNVPDVLNRLIGDLRQEESILAGARNSILPTGKKLNPGPQPDVLLTGWVFDIGALWLNFTGDRPKITRPTGMKANEKITSGPFPSFVRLIVKTNEGGEKFLKDHGDLSGEIRAVRDAYAKQARVSAGEG